MFNHTAINSKFKRSSMPCVCGWQSEKFEGFVSLLVSILFTYMPCWKGQKGQKKKRGYSQRSFFSTVWCLCLHSTEQCSWEDGQLTRDHEMHPDSTATPSLTEGTSKTEKRR